MNRNQDDILDRIRQGVDLLEIVSEHVPLTKKGRNHLGLCPFHSEKTPSFSVNPDRGIYHCFGCGAGGDVFRFVMEIERVSFGEAVRLLSTRAGIPLSSAAGRPGAAPQADQASDLLYRANDLASKYYAALLKREEGRLALDYLKARGVSDEITGRFQLGYSPARWDGFLQVAAKAGLSGDVLERAGLAIRREGGGFYDRFRGRVMFPIASASGRVVAFGARALASDEQAKYLNSPETHIYKKGATLYGLPQARDAIRREGAVLIVEGYMDLLRLAQSGVEHVVASSGTAFTPDHARMLSRYAERVVVVYDGDSAGVSASLRGVDIMLSEGLSPYIAVLPKGHDPDSFVLAEGAEAFGRLVKRAQSFVEFRIGIQAASGALGTVEGKRKVVADLAESVAKVRDEVKRALLVREISEHVGLDEGIIGRSVSARIGTSAAGRPISPRPSGAPQAGTAGRAATDAPVGQEEPPITELRELITVMLRRPELVRQVSCLVESNDLPEGRLRRIVEVIFDLCRQGMPVDPARVIDRFIEEPAIAGTVAELADRGFAEDKADRIVRDCVAAIAERPLTEEIQKVEQLLRQAEKRGAADEATDLLRRHAQLTAEREQRRKAMIDRRWE